MEKKMERYVKNSLLEYIMKQKKEQELLSELEHH